MGFRINTNIAAMNAHRNSVQTNLGLDKSLNSLSSGLRINKAADDASGMTIADSLRSQANGLGQAIRNANDGISVVQTADGALDEYINIVDKVRTLSIQAASDGQNADSRAAIQRDVDKLLEEAQNIATTTSFNGLNLLDGSFTNKNFQIGAYANQTVGVSIGDVRTTAVGDYATVAGGPTTAALAAGDLTINSIDVGIATIDAKDQARAINSVTADTGVTATALTEVVGGAVVGGTSNITINGIAIGTFAIQANDANGALADAINNIADQTNVIATVASGTLTLTAADGEDIIIAGADVANAGLAAATTHGSITLESASAIVIAGTAPANAGLTPGTTLTTGSLETVKVGTYADAQNSIKTADYALKALDAIRSDIGSTQNQLESTIRNISVTQVNVTAAESQIRDVDFAAESANFAKLNILAQSGSYAMSQANAVQQNVLRLLQ